MLRKDRAEVERLATEQLTSSSIAISLQAAQVLAALAVAEAVDSVRELIGYSRTRVKEER